MKRFGEKATREALANGAVIRSWDWYTASAGYRVLVNDEVAGYIVSNLFSKLLRDDSIVCTKNAYSYSDYSAPAAAQDLDTLSARVEADTRAALARAGLLAQEEAATQEETEPAQEEAQEEPKHRVHNVVTDEVLEGTSRALYYALHQRTRWDLDEEEPVAVWEPCDDDARRVLEAVAAATGCRVKIAAVPVDNLLDDLSTGDYGEYLNDYRDSSTYICDAIAEIADNNTSIYYYQIIKFISENVEAVNDAIEEYGWDGCGSDLYKAGQMAEYNAIQADIWENQADALMLAALNFIKWDMKINIVPADLADDIRDWCDDADTNDMMCDIPDKIREYFEEVE